MSASSTSDNGRAWKLDWRRALIPISLLVLFVLYYGFHAPIWVLLIICLWIPLFYIALPMYRRRRWEQFEATFARRFQRGEHKTLLEEYRKQWFLRRFGPRFEMLSKLGLIYSALEKYRHAEQAFEQAIQACETLVPQQLFFNLANVKFELEKYDEAMKIYLTLQGNSPYQRAVRTQMALIDLHKGARVDQAIKHLEQERAQATGSMRDRIDRALENQP